MQYSMQMASFKPGTILLDRVFRLQWSLHNIHPLSLISEVLTCSFTEQNMVIVMIMVSYLVSYLVKTSKVCAVHSVLLHYCKRKRPWRLYSFNNLCAYHLCYCLVDCLSFIYGNSLWSILLLSLYSSCQYQILQGHFLNQ